MESTEIMNIINRSDGARVSSDLDGLPYISQNDKAAKRRVLVQRNKTFSNRHNAYVPPPGKEYDFRRTPDPGRASPKKQFHGQIRPHLPPDTAELDALRINLDESPIPSAAVIMRNKLMERLDVGRCPTPLPSEENFNANNSPYAKRHHVPLNTARSAWSKADVNVGEMAGEDDLADVVYDPDLETPRYPNAPVNDSLRKYKSDAQVNKYDVILSDIEHEHGAMTPTPAYPLDLTENVLHYYFQKPVDKDKRIVKWLIDCEEKSYNQLPTHLPNIAASRRNVYVTFEDA